MFQLSEINRIIPLQLAKNALKGSSATFLWGARKTGKTTTIHQQFPEIKTYDLLDTKLKQRLRENPNILRQEVLANQYSQILIDEIQKVSELLDEVHWLIENCSIDILMCGSSARKIKTSESNLLGGRAIKYELFPLVTAELSEEHLDLNLILNRGLIPSHFLSESYLDFFDSYTADYLENEIAQEARIRNLSNFSRFIKVAGITNGQLLNYSKVASECGVSATTVREYYQILKDTLLGFELSPWDKRKERRLIETSKFYFFDCGLASYLRNVTPVVAGTDVWGHAFEHFLIQEVRAYLKYRKKRVDIYFYRNCSNTEVDLIIGDMQIAIEFKSATFIRTEHLRGLRSLKSEFNIGRSIVVSCDESFRKTEDGIEIIPWKNFCKLLWQDLLYPDR